MEIEVATPEMQAELDSMSVEQLEARVSQEEGAAPPPQGEATGQPQGEIKTEVKPEADAEPAWFTKFKDDYKREQGSLRSLQGLSDKLPALIEKQISQRLAALQQAQTKANLSPEDQQAQDEVSKQTEALQKFVDARADARAEAKLTALAGDYLPLLNELKEQRQQESLQNMTLDIVKDMIPEGAKEVWESVFEKVAKDIEAGVPGSIERFDRLSSNPSEIALAMIQAQRGQVQQQAQQVTQKRQNSAQQAAQSVKSGAVQASGKKSVAEKSQAELDAMSIAELEAEIPSV